MFVCVGGGWVVQGLCLLANVGTSEVKLRGVTDSELSYHVRDFYVTRTWLAL